MYIDQFPESDLSRPIARKYGIPIARTIREAHPGPRGRRGGGRSPPLRRDGLAIRGRERLETPELRIIAESFEEFMRRYRDDPGRLSRAHVTDR